MKGRFSPLPQRQNYYTFFVHINVSSCKLNHTTPDLSVKPTLSSEPGKPQMSIFWSIWVSLEISDLEQLDFFQFDETLNILDQVWNVNRDFRIR